MEAQKEHVTEVIKALNLLSQYVINIVQSKEILMPRRVENPDVPSYFQLICINTVNQHIST